MPKFWNCICFLPLFIVQFSVSAVVYAKEKPNSSKKEVQRTLAEAGISLARAAEDLKDWDKAVELYSNACEEYDVVFCVKAATIAAEKLQNMDLAIQYYRRGCEKGDRLSCYDYGGVLKSAGRIEEARHFYETFCEKNKSLKSDSAIFCLRAGMISEEMGQHDTAKYFFKTACDRKEPTGCFGLGLAYQSEGSYSEAKPYLQSACKSGVKDSCAALKSQTSRYPASK